MTARQKNRTEVELTLSQTLHAARMRLGLTQVQVAEAVGCSHEFYGRCERGEALPSVPLLVRLAEALWNGTEPLAPSPMPDRDIFELLGFD